MTLLASFGMKRQNPFSCLTVVNPRGAHRNARRQMTGCKLSISIADGNKSIKDTALQHC